MGSKKDASIPKLIIESGQVVPFIRGLYRAEGSLYHRYSKRYANHARVYDNLLVVQVRMKLGTLMSQLHEELTSLGIGVNRLVCKDGVYTFRITNQGEIAKFFAMVKPRYKTTASPTIF